MQWSVSNIRVRCQHTKEENRFCIPVRHYLYPAIAYVCTPLCVFRKSGLASKLRYLFSRSQIEHFTLQIYHQSIAITIARYFKVNNTFLFTVNQLN